MGSVCSLPGQTERGRQRAWKRAGGCSARGRLAPGGPDPTKCLELHQHVHRYPGDVMSSANPQSGVIFCHWDNTEGKQTWTDTSSFAQNYLIPEKQVNNARQLGICSLLLNSLHNSYIILILANSSCPAQSQQERTHLQATFCEQTSG